MKDNEMLVFGSDTKNMERFIKTLKKQKKSDIWKRCYVKELKVHPLNYNPICIPLLRKKMYMDCSDETLLETMEGKRSLLLEFPLKKMIYVPMRNIAFKSLCSRAHLSGSVLQKMSNDDLCKVINICLQEWEDSCLVLYRDYKISSIHSGDEGDYSILNAYDLFNTLQLGIKRQFGEFKFQSGYLSHGLCRANLIIENEHIIKIYQPYLVKMGFHADEKFQPMVKFSTSDVAACGANIAPYITNGKKHIQIGTPLSVLHKNRSNIEDFKKNVESIYALFQTSTKKIKELDNIVLAYPLDCFANVCKKLDISKSNASEAITYFEANMTEKSTALDMYSAMWQIIGSMKHNEESESKLFSLQEKIARILTLDIKELDYKE